MSEQHDDHIWLTINGEAWAINEIIGTLIVLWRGYAPNIDWAFVETTGMNWAAYCEAAAARLK
jgi:hypothetical protein